MCYKVRLNFISFLSPLWVTPSGLFFYIIVYKEVQYMKILYRPCRHGGCGNLVAVGGSCYCEKHQEDKKENRPSAYRRGYDRRWSTASSNYLNSHPFCAECERKGIKTLATEVDHIKPHRGNKELFWDMTNWQPLCHSCHSEKTAKEDNGGWY